MRRADAQPKSPSSTPPISLPLPPDLHCEYKRRHRNSLSSCFEELKTTPPRTPACRFTRVGGWDSGSESEDDRIVSPPAEGKFDDDDENDINELGWKSERILDLDGQEEKHDGTHEDAHHGSNTHFDNLDQGMLPGTNVIIKRSNLKAKILRKSLFHGQLKYLVKLDSSGLESEHESSEIEISEPPLGWVVKWSENDVTHEDEGQVSEFSGLVIGASWFREVKRVEVELEKGNTVWKDFDNVRFIEPISGTRVACNYKDEDGNESVKSGVIEGRSTFRNESRFQVKFDEGGDAWVDLQNFISPNEFRNL
ncbi:hypothetical protein TrVE_jg14137 [Triparma verrucosa]|uniref:Uncharacterized protein n=1 Tax=Triparma verrucosa TaxID=1606542 RepID=A0A9W7C4Y3_9STRA|nr:hypothetical protein TrVE_jg14137 [Triparma verrucosa]